MKMSKFARWAILIVVLLVAAYAGLRTGTALRHHAEPVVTEGPRYPFQLGDSLPDVQLADSAEATVHSETLLSGPGTIVLFLDPNCDGCLDMSRRWQQAIVDGVVPADRIIGISRADRDANEHYRAEHGLRFPIYQDVESAFLRQHGVTTYPLEVVVGTSGKVEWVSDNSRAEIDADKIRSLMVR